MQESNKTTETIYKQSKYYKTKNFRLSCTDVTFIYVSLNNYAAEYFRLIELYFVDEDYFHIVISFVRLKQARVYCFFEHIGHDFSMRICSSVLSFEIKKSCLEQKRRCLLKLIVINDRNLILLMISWGMLLCFSFL